MAGTACPLRSNLEAYLSQRPEYELCMVKQLREFCFLRDHGRIQLIYGGVNHGGIYCERNGSSYRSTIFYSLFNGRTEVQVNPQSALYLLITNCVVPAIAGSVRRYGCMET